MQNMLRLPSRVAPQIVMMKSADMISGILDTEIRAVLNHIADTPLPAEVMDGKDDEDGEDREGL